MALFKITASSTVKSFSKAFKDEFGATLQIYDGRLKADDSVKLVDIGAKTGPFECRSSRTVGSFVKMMQDEFNLKVKVRTADDWVTVIDGLTLNRINDLPKQPTKTMMEDFVSYQRKDAKNKDGETPEATAEKYLYLENLEPKRDENRLYGFVDSDGNWVIKPKFDYLSEFCEGLARANSDKKFGFINEKGKWVIKPVFDDVASFHEGITQAKLDGKWGLIDRTGNWVIEPNFDYLSQFYEGLAIAKLDGKFGFIDHAGNWVIEPKFDFIIGDFQYHNDVQVKIDGKYGLIDKSGRWIVKPEMDKVSNLKNGVAIASFDGKFGLIGETGEWIVQPRFKHIQDTADEYFATDDGSYYGLIDKKGNWVIEPGYSAITLFNSDGIAKILKDGKCGFIRRDGSWAQEPHFDYVFGDGTEELYRVVIDGKFGVMDRNGRSIIEPKYDYISEFTDGVAVARLDGQSGTLSSDGTFTKKDKEPVNVNLTQKRSGAFLYLGPLTNEDEIDFDYEFITSDSNSFTVEADGADAEESSVKDIMCFDDISIIPSGYTQGVNIEDLDNKIDNYYKMDISEAGSVFQNAWKRAQTMNTTQVVVGMLKDCLGEIKDGQEAGARLLYNPHSFSVNYEIEVAGWFDHEKLCCIYYEDFYDENLAKTINQAVENCQFLLNWVVYDDKVFPCSGSDYSLPDTKQVAIDPITLGATEEEDGYDDDYEYDEGWD